MSYSIDAIAQKITGQVIGDGKIVIESATSFDEPKARAITFISDSHHLEILEKSEIGCIIVPKQVLSSRKPLIQVENPKLAFAQVLALFHPAPSFSGEISKLASVSPSAKIGKQVTIEPFAYVGSDVILADRSVIRSHAYVDDGVVIGTETVIQPNVTIYRNTKIGSRVVIHAGAVIGADGFGFVFDGKAQVKIPQVGGVTIEDDVEIGAATAIDRATVGETRIGKGTKIDNQVQIAHNVQIGAHCAISAKCGISGSSKIGNYVVMGGGVGIADHVEVGDGVMLGAYAGVPAKKKIPPKQVWFGQPARPYEEMRKQVGAQLRAAETLEEVREIKKKLAELSQEIEALKASSKS